MQPANRNPSKIRCRGDKITFMNLEGTPEIIPIIITRCQGGATPTPGADTSASAGDDNVDGAANTASGASLSMALGSGTLTLATASEDRNSTNNTEFGASYVMTAAGGTLSLGFTGTDGDTAAKEGEAVSAAYSTTLGGASVAIGYTGHDANNKTANQTDVTFSSPLGGGASIFAEYTNVSGDIAASSSTKDATVIALGTSVSF